MRKKKPDTVTRMTPEQASILRKLAFDAYEPEAFSPELTAAEEEQRIGVLQAKLKLMSEPPHTQLRIRDALSRAMRNPSRRARVCKAWTGLQEEELMSNFRHAAIVAGLVAGATTARAQTTMITRQPSES